MTDEMPSSMHASKGQSEETEQAGEDVLDEQADEKDKANPESALEDPESDTAQESSDKASEEKPEDSISETAGAKAEESKSSGSVLKKAKGRRLGPNKEKLPSNKIIRDRFQLKRKVGAGGMGTVYKAIDQIMVEADDKNPYVAVKILRDELRSNKEAFKALQREYRKQLKLAHPNIVQVYDFDREDGFIYMTMEFLEGKDLARVLKKFRGRGIPFEKAAELIEGICDALMHAHKNNLIHYDFKPGNIYVTTSGVAKVFDFGISRAVKHKFQAKGDETCFEPKTFTALTPVYASPEMIEGEEPNVRDDIFSLAVVTYEMLAGKHPYDRVASNDARDQQLEPEPIKGLSNRQWSTLKAALSLHRETRLSSVKSFREGLLHRISVQQIYRRTILGSLFLLVALFQFVAINVGS